MTLTNINRILLYNVGGSKKIDENDSVHSVTVPHYFHVCFVAKNAGAVT